jgi:hypothetical protein
MIIIIKMTGLISNINILYFYLEPWLLLLLEKVHTFIYLLLITYIMNASYKYDYYP